jgi:hypothetical protein
VSKNSKSFTRKPLDNNNSAIRQAATVTADLSNGRKRRDLGLDDSVSQRLMVPLAVVMDDKFFHGPAQ